MRTLSIRISFLNSRFEKGLQNMGHAGKELMRALSVPYVWETDACTERACEKLMRALNVRVRNWRLAPPKGKVTSLYFSPKVTNTERLYGVKKNHENPSVRKSHTWALISDHQFLVNNCVLYDPRSSTGKGPFPPTAIGFGSNWVSSLDPYLEPIKEIREEISCFFEVLNVLFGGLEVYFVVWKFFMEA